MGKTHTLIYTLALQAAFLSSHASAASSHDTNLRCDGDITSALQTALSNTAKSRDTVFLDAASITSTCVITKAINIPPYGRLIGRGKPVLVVLGSGEALKGDSETRDFLISGITIDASGSSSGNLVALTGSSEGTIDSLVISKAGNAISLLSNTNRVTISHLKAVNSKQHGVVIHDSYDNTVFDAVLDGQAGFGVIITGNSSGNLVSMASTVESGLELVGITVNAHDNVVSDSKASRTGDNCYSVTGRDNRLRNIVGQYCAGNGITFYGSHNVLDGGTFINNNQKAFVRDAWSAAIQFSQGFGGVAQYNTVENVLIDDDQVKPTQLVGVMTFGRMYLPWTANSAIRRGDYRYSNLYLYRANSSGITGSRAPSGESNFIEPAVSWELVNKFESSILPDFNRVVSADIRRVGRHLREDASGATHNVGTR